MSNFDIADFKRLYNILQPHFQTLAEESEGNNVYLSVNTNPDGTIEFSSREYFEKDNNYCVSSHTIRQIKPIIEENSGVSIISHLKK